MQVTGYMEGLATQGILWKLSLAIQTMVSTISNMVILEATIIMNPDITSIGASTLGHAIMIIMIAVVIGITSVIITDLITIDTIIAGITVDFETIIIVMAMIEAIATAHVIEI